MSASKQPQRKAQIARLVEERGWNRPCPANIFFHVVPNTMAMESEDEQRAVAVPVAALDGRQGMSPPRRRGFGTNGPDFRIFAGTTVEFGAAWKKTSDKGNSYLSVKLDDPSFAAPIYASLVETETEELALIWSRRRAAN